jgi:hypothetical protein
MFLCCDKIKIVSRHCVHKLLMAGVQNVAGVCGSNRLYTCEMIGCMCLLVHHHGHLLKTVLEAFVFLSKCICKIVFIKLDSI